MTVALLPLLRAAETPNVTVIASIAGLANQRYVHLCTCPSFSIFFFIFSSFYSDIRRNLSPLLSSFSSLRPLVRDAIVSSTTIHFILDSRSTHIQILFVSSACTHTFQSSMSRVGGRRTSSNPWAGCDRQDSLLLSVASHEARRL